MTEIADGETLEEETPENCQEKTPDLLENITGFRKSLALFWLFIKVNTLTTSGPASIGLLYKESVNKLMTESEFIEAVGFSSVVPGSEAMKMAMFVGYAAGGISGVLAALAGAILPPTVMMLAVVALLQRLHQEAWVTRFVHGLVPAVAVLIVLVAWDIFKGSESGIKVIPLILALVSLAALILNAPAPLILLGAGVLGILLFR